MNAPQAARKYRIKYNTPAENGVATVARALIKPGTNEIVAEVNASGILTGSGITSLLPVGSVIAYAGATAPTNWALCYGQELAVASYPVLDALLGTTYGARTDGAGGAGSTHFRVPDLRGRVVAGQDDMGGVSANRLTSALNGDTLGATGGSETIEASEPVQATGAAFGFSQESNDLVQPTIILNYIIKLT